VLDCSSYALSAEAALSRAQENARDAGAHDIELPARLWFDSKTMPRFEYHFVAPDLSWAELYRQIGGRSTVEGPPVLGSSRSPQSDLYQRIFRVS
jgi:hypothetical protein